MMGNNFVLNQMMITVLGVDTVLWYRSGLHCRTKISG